MSSPAPRSVLAGLALTATVASLLVATPAAAAPTLTTVMVTSPTNIDGFKGVNPACPRGTKLLGGGADILGGGHNVHIAGINPLPGGEFDNSMWVTAVVSSSGGAGPWSLTAWAICGAGVTGYEIVEAKAAAPMGVDYVSATASCPAGKKVIGAGGRQQGKAFIVLDGISVDADLSGVTVESFSDETAHVTVPVAVAYAICVDPLPGQQRVTAATEWTSSDKLLSVGCPAGTRLYGLGGGLTGASGQAYLDGVLPYAGTLTGAQIDAREDHTGFSATWKANVYGICAN